MQPYIFLGSTKGTSYDEHGKPHSYNDDPALVKFYENGSVKSKTWCKHGIIHRDKNPAVIRYGKEGKVEVEIWFKDGEIHRPYGAAITKYFPNGNPKEKSWLVNGVPHRKRGKPIRVFYRENGTVKAREWNNRSHFIDFYYEDGDLQASFWEKNVLELPPAFENPVVTFYYKNGFIEAKFWLNTPQHPRDLKYPAVAYYYRDGSVRREEWRSCENGELHRDGDEPAVIEYSPEGVITRKEWYTHGLPSSPVSAETFTESGTKCWTDFSLDSGNGQGFPFVGTWCLPEL